MSQIFKILFALLTIAISAHGQQTQRLVISGNDTIAGWMWNTQRDSVVFSRTKKMMFNQKGDTLHKTTISDYHLPPRFRIFRYEEATSDYFSITRTLQNDTIEKSIFDANDWHGYKLDFNLDTQKVFLLKHHDTLILGPFGQSFQMRKMETELTTISIQAHFYYSYRSSEFLKIEVHGMDSVYKLASSPDFYVEFRRTKDYWKVRSEKNGVLTQYGSTRTEDIAHLTPEYFFRQRTSNTAFLTDHTVNTFCERDYHDGQAKTYLLRPDNSRSEVEDSLIEKLILSVNEELFGYARMCRGSITYKLITSTSYTNQDDSLFVIDEQVDFGKYFLIRKAELDYFETRDCARAIFEDVRYSLVFKKGMLNRVVIETNETKCTIEKENLARTNYLFEDLLNKKMSIDYRIIERNNETSEWNTIEQKHIPNYSGTIAIITKWTW
jgi:hypothetical protein